MRRFHRVYTSLAVVLAICLLVNADSGANAQSQIRRYKQRSPEGKTQLIYLGGGEWHDYLATAAIIRWDLETGENYYVTYTEDQDILRRLDKYDAVLLNHMHLEMTDEQERCLLDAVQHGKPLVVLHATPAAYTKPGKRRPDFQAMVGTDGVQPKHPPIGTFRVKVADTHHPITQGLSDFDIYDELFLLGNQNLQPDIHVLLTAEHAGKVHPLAWTHTYGSGRIFYLALGHGEESVGSPNFQKLLRRGLHWVMYK